VAFRSNTERNLTPGEIARLSPGLWSALQAAGAHPRLVAKVSPFARAASLWRGEAPILTLGVRVFWPGLPADLSRAGSGGHIAVLQHELQHVLDFATGRLSVLRYAVDPRNWSYGYTLVEGRPFYAYGAEQRASMAEDLWRLDHGLHAPAINPAHLRRLIPWAYEPGRGGATAT
jgi:hypothetical protein